MDADSETGWETDSICTTLSMMPYDNDARSTCSACEQSDCSSEGCPGCARVVEQHTNVCDDDTVDWAPILMLQVVPNVGG